MSILNNITALASGIRENSMTKQAAAPVQQEDEVTKEAAEKQLAVTALQCISANLKAIHVKTKSYAQHMALDTAFDDLNEALDTFYECVQGHYVMKTGRRLPLVDQSYTFSMPSEDGLLAAIRKMQEVFDSASSALVHGVSALESVRDDVTNCFNQLAYRFTLK